jgi:putative two-component system response regulator
MLEDEYDIVTIKSGKAALDLLLHGLVPDLILQDLVMPGMDGWDTFSRTRTISGVHKIPIVFLAASSNAGDIDQARRNRGCRFYYKALQ